MRTAARETVFKLVFSEQFGQAPDKQFKIRLYSSEELTNDDIAYCENILKLIDLHGEEISAVIDKQSYSFPEVRIFPADKSVLFVALAEILYCDDIPDRVSVNEAANIASKYSSEKSASFISGILSSVIGEKNV